MKLPGKSRFRRAWYVHRTKISHVVRIVWMPPRGPGGGGNRVESRGVLVRYRPPEHLSAIVAMT